MHEKGAVPIPLDHVAGHSPRRWPTFGNGILAWALFTAIWTANLVLVAITVYGFFVSGTGHDWAIFEEAGRRVARGGLYRWDANYAWSYSPLLAYLFAALTPIGFIGWSILHAAALAALRDRWLALVTAVSWPFWVDLYNGNTMVFVFVAAATAIRGSTTGTAGYLFLSLLMPRPLMLPVLVWILWKRPDWRIRFAFMTIAYAGVMLLSGQAMAWIQALTRISDAVAMSSRDVGPGVLLGGWWLWVGLMLAIVLTIRGRVGLASLAASAYWLPQYLIMGLLELLPQRSGVEFAGRPNTYSGGAAPGPTDENHGDR
jgi:hypothetical protein